MSEFKLTTVEEFEAATERLLETGAKVGADAWQFRVKNQTPHCKFGEEGVCCRICSMGPCRITKKAPRGICGCDVHGIVGRNYLKFTAGGSATHSDHGREICHTLYESSADGCYQVKDPEKLIRIAKEWGVETEGKDIYDLAHEVAEMGLWEYGKPFGTQRFLKRAPQSQQELWEKNELAPRAIDREVSCSLHMAHMGCSSLPEALIKQSIRAGLSDGWGGSMMGTEFSDVLFGTPKPIDTEANLGVMVEENVNIVVHGHDPSLSEMVCEYADSPEMIAYAKEMGAKGITVSGVCCTSNEVAMRRGIPMAGNFLQQENVVLTGACEAIVVDVQCIFPALGPLSKCFHTKFITTSPIAQMPDSEFIRFDAKTADEKAKLIVKTAIENFKNRKPELVHIPQLKQKATVGYSVEAIIKCLDGVANSQVDEMGTVKPLLQCVTSGVLRGAVAMVGCNNPKIRPDLAHIELMSNLHQMYFAQAQNHALYKQGNPKANVWADECERLFKRDSLICDYYNHKMAGGKWNGMMTQKHIGYKSWNDDFEKDTCPELFRVTSKDGVIISEHNGVVEIEAPYYSSKTDAAEAKWTEIPFMGKSVSAMTLMPYTKSVKGASITYKFKMQVSKTSDGKAFNGKQKVRIHVITKSTLDYLNKGGLTYGVSLDDASPVEVNFNKDLNEKPENIYNIYYPTIATRIVDKVIELELPASSDGIHSLTLTPNDPAIVFEKIVIDGREGKKSVKVI